MLTPGLNIIRLNKIASQIERYYLGQIGIHIGKMELLSPPLNPKLLIEVKKEEPSIRLDKGDLPLFSGLEQIMQLTITVGSYNLDPVSFVSFSLDYIFNLFLFSGYND